MKLELITMKNLTFNQDLLRIIQQVSICYQYDFWYLFILGDFEYLVAGTRTDRTSLKT